MHDEASCPSQHPEVLLWWHCDLTGNLQRMNSHPSVEDQDCPKVNHQGRVADIQEPMRWTKARDIGSVVDLRHDIDQAFLDTIGSTQFQIMEVHFDGLP